MDDTTTRSGLVSASLALLALTALFALAPTPLVASDDVEVIYEPPSDDTGLATLSIAVDSPAWEAVDERGYRATIDGFGIVGESGLPDLPARVERIALAPGARVSIVQIDVAWEEGLIPGPVLGFPARSPRSSVVTAADLPSAGPWPAEPVVLGSQNGMLRDQRFASLEIRPLQVDLASGTYRLARRIFVHLRHEGAEPRVSSESIGGASSPLFRDLGARMLRGGDVTAPVASTTSRDASADPSGTEAFEGPGWQIRVDREGLYRLDYSWMQINAPDLLAFVTSDDPRRLRLRAQGVDVPIRVEGEADGVFGPGDAIVFFGELLVGDPFSPDDWQQGNFSDVNVYRLDFADGAPRVGDDPLVAPPSFGNVPPSFRDTMRREDNTKFTNFVPETGGDHWVVDPFLLSSGTLNLDQVVDTPDHVGGSVQVRVRLMGFERLHQTEIRVDGSLEDTQDWDGLIDFTHDFPVDRSGAPLGAQTTVNVAITNARDDDQVAVNWVEIDYDRAYRANLGRLDFDVAPGADREVRLDGFGSGVEVWEVTTTAATQAGLTIAQPRRVEGLALRDGKPSFDVASDGRTRRFVAAEGGGYLLPAADDVVEDTPTDACASGSLTDPACEGSWLVLGPAELLTGPNLTALANSRTAQGHVPAIVDVQDVYDEFSFGLDDPEAIRRFVDAALPDEAGQGGWQVPPEVIVLVGDASYDYQNFLGHTEPTNVLSTYTGDLPENDNYKLYASDLYFVQVRGDDELPDALVGRIPARSLAEAEVVFGKILDYESIDTFAAWRGQSMMVSEAPENTSDALGTEFREIHDEMYARWIPGGPQTATKVYETDPWTIGCTQAAEDHNANIDANINLGAAVTTYAGHGSFRLWGKSCPFFETQPPPNQAEDDLEDVDFGAPLQFHVHANCVTGAFSVVSAPGASNDNSYAFMEDWLLTEGKGAVAAIAPSHLSFDYLLEPIISPVYSELFGKRKERVAGLIDLKMRTGLSNLNYVTPLRSMIFFGDPLTRLAVPAPTATRITAIEQDGNRALRVEWESTPDASSYRVYRAGNPGGPYVMAGEVGGTTTSFVDTGLTNCREYFYYVTAVDAQGFESRWSNYNELCFGERDPEDCKFGTPEDPLPPDAPTWPTNPEPVVDLEQGGRLQVTWNEVPGTDIVEYIVRYGTVQGGPYPEERVVNAATTSVVLSGLEDKVEHFIVVHSAHCSQESPPSDERSGTPHLVRGLDPPAAITDLTVTVVADELNAPTDGLDDTQLTWSAPSESEWGKDTDVAAYEIYGSSERPDFVTNDTSRLATISAGETSWIHELAPASPPNWYYLVVAIDSDDLSSASSGGSPQAVDDFFLYEDPARPGTIQLRWTERSGGLFGAPGLAVAGYRLYGRDSILPRAEAGETNLIDFFEDLPGDGLREEETPLPAGVLFTYHLITVDHHGSEAVW